MMKKLFFILFLVVFSNDLTAQNSIITQWKELNNYDALLKKTYRLAEVGDLKPIRANAEILVDFARDMTDEELSPEFNSFKNNQKLKELIQETEELQQAVKKKVDNKILFEKFTKLRSNYKKFIREIDVKN